MVYRLATLAVIAGCGGPTGDPATSTSETSDPTGTPSTPTPPSVDTGDTDPGDTDEPTLPAGTDPWDLVQVDCAAGNDAPFTYELLNWAPAAEDFTFDAHGYELAVSVGGLSRTPFGGPLELLVPNFPEVKGTRVLPDGRVAMAATSQGAILVIDPDTGSEVAVAGGLNTPNGIAIGYDGWIYVATFSQIVRVEPDLGLVEVVVDMPNHSFDGITFSPDFKRLYFNEEFGRIHFVDFDENGVPGNAFEGPQIPIGVFSILDGMATDACGNLYVTEMGGKVWRVAPGGAVDLVFDAQELLAVVPALNFGTGIDGWDANTLYVMRFTGGLFALDVGLPGKWEPHWPIPIP